MKVYVRIPDGHAKARFAGEYKPEVFWGLSSEYSPQNTWRAASGCWLYLDKNDYWMITDNEIEVGPHSSRGHIHSKEKARGRAPTEMMAWVSNTPLRLGSQHRKVWQDAPEIFIDAAVRPCGEGSGGDGAEAPELSPPPAIGPDGVPIEAKPSNTVESEKPQNVIGPNGVPIEAKPSNTVESEKQ